MIIIEIPNDIYCFKCLTKYEIIPINIVRKEDGSLDHDKTEIVFKHLVYEQTAIVCEDNELEFSKPLTSFLQSNL